MPGDSEHPSEKIRIFDTEPYHLEKYVVPGAVAVALLFLLPWYLLGGNGPSLAGSDLATIVIVSLVLGHTMEAFALYQRGPAVKKNFERVNEDIRTVLKSVVDEKKMPAAPFETLMRPLFRICPREHSEFAWNLVRWQKMIVIAILLWLAAAQWLLFAFLGYMESKGCNPFNTTWRIVILKPESDPWASVLAVAVVVATLFVAGLASCRC